MESWPQILEPRVELSFKPEVMLVVTETHLVEQGRPQVQQPLSQFLSHRVKQSI